MKKLIAFCCLLIAGKVNAQELFTMTEPASNRPAHSIAIRVDNSMMGEIGSSHINYHLIPEIMLGVSQKWMINGALFFSDRTKQLRYEGAGIYIKYRFLSHDKVQQHFRMAAFGRLSYNNSDIHQEEIDMYGHNTGMELGVIATQLIRKVALSSSVSFAGARDNGNGNKFVYGTQQARAVSYTLSMGKLLMPREYRSYQQININCMLELMGQLNTGSGKYYLDIAPAVQLIVNSQARIDVSYRRQLMADLLRTAPNGVFIRLEYNFFNVL